MKTVIGSDDAGFELKETLRVFLSELGHEVSDVGTYSTDPVDYPDVAAELAHVVSRGDADRGLLICGSGVGVSVAANKFPGIRAGLCHDVYSAHQGVEHDAMNVLVLGARVIGPELARDLVRTYMSARFSGEARHVRRLEKVKGFETLVRDNTQKHGSEGGAR